MMNIFQSPCQTTANHSEFVLSTKPAKPKPIKKVRIICVAVSPIASPAKSVFCTCCSPKSALDKSTAHRLPRGLFRQAQSSPKRITPRKKTSSSKPTSSVSSTAIVDQAGLEKLYKPAKVDPPRVTNKISAGSHKRRGEMCHSLGGVKPADRHQPNSSKSPVATTDRKVFAASSALPSSRASVPGPEKVQMLFNRLIPNQPRPKEASRTAAMKPTVTSSTKTIGWLLMNLDHLRGSPFATYCSRLRSI